MGKIDKLIAKLKGNPKDFTWSELKKVLAYFGFIEIKKKGKTGGSRRKFKNATNDIIISLHEPHPDNIVKSYVVKQIKEYLNL